MCIEGLDLGWNCRLCGKPILFCYDYGPSSVCWHKYPVDAARCLAATLARLRSTTLDDPRVQ